MPGVRPGRTLRLLPPSFVVSLRLASPLANPKCSSGSIGLPNRLPPSAGPDWDSAQLPDPLLLGSPTSPSAPAFLAVSPPAPPVLLWVLAALGAELSLASLSVPSSWETCYSSSRVDLLIHVIAPSSAWITGSLNAIRDRGSTFSSHLTLRFSQCHPSVPFHIPKIRRKLGIEQHLGEGCLGE